MSTPRLVRPNGGPIPLGKVPILGQPPTIDVDAGFGDDGPAVRLTDPRTGATIEIELVLALRVSALIDEAAADLIQAMQRMAAEAGPQVAT